MFRVGLLVGLIVLNSLIFSLERDRILTVSFFDVGQGDSILIEGPTGIQLLVDGGPDKSALRELGQVLPFYDRKIDAVLATHPDLDHIGGLIDVFDRYDVGTFIESGVNHETGATEQLELAITKENSEKVVARAGMRFILGGGAYADVLYPDRDVSNIESNAGSVILRVVYGDNEFMLTGDAPKAVEGYVLSQNKNTQSDVLKAGHHGSKTSTLDNFLESVAPTYVVVSAGEGNKYGHPAEEVINRIQNFGAHIVSTIDSGTITFKTNGTKLKIEK